MVVEVQQVENRIFWCGVGFHQHFCIGTVCMPIVPELYRFYIITRAELCEQCGVYGFYSSIYI